MNKACNLAVVVMAGGLGTRFWPASTPSKPKQFLSFAGGPSLLQECFERALSLAPPAGILVMTNAAQKRLVLEQLPAVPEANVVCEPFRRDTAAAVALAAALCARLFGDPVMAVFPSDHAIRPLDVFRKTVLSAAGAAASGTGLFTFGIRPASPETGYGWIEKGREVLDDGGVKHFEVGKFKEKPDLPTARKYLESGRFLWNSGMFVWRASAILDRIRRFLPAHHRAVLQAAESHGLPGWDAALKAAFDPLESVSIDYGVLEKASGVTAVEALFEWSDVGGWTALEAIMARDGAGNFANCGVDSLDSTGNIVYCEDPGRPVALVGARDLIIVHAGGRILVAHKSRAQDVKKLVERLGKG